MNPDPNAASGTLREESDKFRLSLPPGTANILIVDDRNDNLFLMERVLSGFQQNIVKVTSGEDALRALLEREYAVILLDVRMPLMDGYETAELIRRRPSSRHVPIIFVSAGDDTPENITRGYAAGAVDYLFKPFLPEVLQAKVRFFLELHVKREELFRTNRKLENESIERRRVEKERDRVNAQLLQAQKLQAVGQLAAGVAHEINNPVGWILSNAGSVRKYLEELTKLVTAARDALDRIARGEPPEKAHAEFETLWKDIRADFLLKDCAAALEDCRGGAERIRDIVLGMRGFVHADESLLKTADLAAVLDSSLNLCRSELRFRIRVHRDYADLGMLTCYPQQLEQIFVNLLVNSAQAIGDLGDVYVSGRRTATHAEIRIRDTGSGIDPENLGKLFEPFFTTKPVGKGTGLGLHVAYKIIKSHAGEIDVKSEPGKGTEFFIRLPLEGPRPSKT